jgi:hypothetical protein
MFVGGVEGTRPVACRYIHTLLGPEKTSIAWIFSGWGWRFSGKVDCHLGGIPLGFFLGFGVVVWVVVGCWLRCA